MKISPEHFATLNTALIETLKAHGLHPFMVASDRHMWDVFHKAWREKRIDGNAMYKEYTDANILTALRRIFKR